MNIMPGSRLSNLRDYLAMIVRRKWIMLFTFLGCLGVALLIASVIPNEYESESLILFRPGEVSSDLVKQITDGAPDERMTAIQETILSRSNLLGIIREFQGKAKAYSELTDEKKIRRMRDRLEVQFLFEKPPKPTPEVVAHLKIRYREQSPELAQTITARVASLFIAQENRNREDQIYTTAKFLQGQLSGVMNRLAESSGKLKAMKEQFRDELPTQMQVNLMTLDRLQQQKTANAEALDRQITLKATLEKQLSQTPAKIGAGIVPGTTARNPLVDSYLKKEADYKDLVAKATDKHPDVIRMKSELDNLRKSIPPEDLDAAASDGSQLVPRTQVNPAYQTLVADLSKTKTEIEIRNREKRSLEGQIVEMTRRLQNTPRAEQEIAAAERSNADLAKMADDLKTKLAQAKLSETVESRRQNAQFVVVDPANLPMDAASPNRMVLQMAAIAISLALAFLAGTITDLSNRRVFTTVELERMLNAPVLVEIPRITSVWHSLQMRRMRIKFVAIFLISSAVYAWGLYHLYSNQSYLAKMLEPIIQSKAGSTNAEK